MDIVSQMFSDLQYMAIEKKKEKAGGKFELDIGF